MFQCICVQILPAYRKHQHRTVQILYAATKKQIPRVINILWTVFYHTTTIM